MFQVIRIYNDSNGHSCFENVEIPLKEDGIVGKFSPVLLSNKILLWGNT